MPIDGANWGEPGYILISTSQKSLIHRKWKALLDNETADEIRWVGPTALVVRRLRGRYPQLRE
jgi:hypothetical protein